MERRDNSGRLLARGEYQRRDGSYEYRCTDPRTGATRSVCAKTLGELRRKEQSLREDVEVGVARKGRTITLDQVFDIWHERRELDVAAGLLRQHSLDSYAYLWRTQVRGSRLGKCKAASLGTELMQDHYRSMLANGLSVGTVETLHGIVAQVVKYACTQGWCAQNCAHGALTAIQHAARRSDEAKGKHDHPHCLLPEEEDALIAELKSPAWKHYAPIVRFLLHTGLRASELGGLLPEDVCDDAVWVRRDLRYTHDAEGHMSYVVTPPKSASSRRKVPLTDEAKHDLADWIALGKRCAQEVCGITGMVFCKPRESALTYAAINKVLHAIARAANERAAREVIPKGLTCHWLRHTFITNAIDKGVPVQVVSALVGHENVETTWRRYYTCRQSTVDKGIDILNQAARAAARQPTGTPTSRGLTLFNGGPSTKNRPKSEHEIVGHV